MKRFVVSSAFAIRALCSVAALLAVPFAAHAQQGDETVRSVFRIISPAAQNAAQTEPATTTGSRKSARSEKKTALKRVLLSMQNKEAEARATGVPGSEGDGITLLAESSVADAGVTPVTDMTTASNVEAQLDKLVKELPRGTRWVKLMLPPTPKNKTLHGDDVADYALAQARMYGSVGEAVLPKGGVEVISQPLTGDKAKTVVPALNLRPVYLLLNPDAHVALMRNRNGFDFVQQGGTVFFGTMVTPVEITIAPATADE